MRLPPELGLSEAAPLVGFPSRPAPETGLDLLAGVVQRTLRSVPGVRFAMAGEFGYRPRYEALFQSLGLAGQVCFLGHMAAVERFLAACDVVVPTSKAKSVEGSPNTLPEAMAMERPLVATPGGRPGRGRQRWRGGLPT